MSVQVIDGGCPSLKRRHVRANRFLAVFVLPDSKQVARLNIVILHCHLERGGVTQVIENHVRSLRDREDVSQIVLVSGNRASGLSKSTRQAVKQLTVDDFDYDDRRWEASNLVSRATALASQITSELDSLDVRSSESILHWHNHSLGKNTAGPEVIRSLGMQGWRLLLQIHDFAEDNRPENYLRLLTASGASTPDELDRYLYPVADQIRYCTLTHADAAVLREVGIPADSISCLPNSVVAPDGIDLRPEEARRKLRETFDLPGDARWCLYPVRGIRRKNVGELLLLSQLASSDQYFGLTLAPTTPIESRSYQRWRQLADQLTPRVVFGAGERPEVSFGCNLLASDCVVSTSVAEGFGMAFLEPWLVNREVIARRLPTVAEDFEASGMLLSKFYKTAQIPGDSTWIAKSQQQFCEAHSDAWRTLPESFRPEPSAFEPGMTAFDFAMLTPSRQIEVVTRIARDEGFRGEVVSQNPDLVRGLRSESDAAAIEHNAKAVAENYSTATTSKRLMALYDSLAGGTMDIEISAPANVGTTFAAVNRARPYYPCRTENPA